MNAENKKGAPAAGKGVDDAMVRLAWRDAYGAWLETKNRGSLSEADDAAVSALAAALTRQPVAGDGMDAGWPVSDDELPGMWERADFMGGKTDCEREGEA